MAHDLVIRGGTLIDGTGAPARRADVAIDGDTISEVGAVAYEGRREIDARGFAVTPGFVDIHTHLDAQIGWDPWLTPLSWHGVTSALIGNCGMTFAPVRPGQAPLLAGMMETVEDIPREAILGGLPWTWESYGGYLDALDTKAPSINVGGLVGHCAVRFYVMGDRAVDESPTEDEIAGIAELVGRSLVDGAVGFSTSRIIGHVLPDGRDIPGTHAPRDEILAIARAVKAAGGGLMQNVLDLSGKYDSELELLRAEAEATGDRVLFSITAGRSSDSGRRLNAVVDGMRADGLDVSGIAIPRGSGFVVGLVNELPWRAGAWCELGEMDFDARLAALDDRFLCERLVADAANDDHVIARSPMFWLGDGETPDYVFREETSIEHLAACAGEAPAETFLRMSRERRGRALFTRRFFNPNLRAVEDLIAGNHIVPGLSDAGAHVGQVMDSGWASFVLAYWVRERRLFTVEEAVRRMSAMPARIMGLADRGLIRRGWKADLNVVDLDRVAERMPEFVHDFPNGAGRFVQRARGYRATVCNGAVILENDEHTGARGGRVLRRG